MRIDYPSKRTKKPSRANNHPPKRRTSANNEPARTTDAPNKQTEPNRPNRTEPNKRNGPNVRVAITMLSIEARFHSRVDGVAPVFRPRPVDDAVDVMTWPIYQPGVFSCPAKKPHRPERTGHHPAKTGPRRTRTRPHHRRMQPHRTRPDRTRTPRAPKPMPAPDPTPVATSRSSSMPLEADPVTMFVGGGRRNPSDGRERILSAHNEPRCSDQRRSELAARRSTRSDAARRLRTSREDFPLRPRTYPRADRARARFRCARLLRMHQPDS